MPVIFKLITRNVDYTLKLSFPVMKSGFIYHPSTLTSQNNPYKFCRNSTRKRVEKFHDLKVGMWCCRGTIFLKRQTTNAERYCDLIGQLNEHKVKICTKQDCDTVYMGAAQRCVWRQNDFQEHLTTAFPRSPSSGEQ